MKRETLLQIHRQLCDAGRKLMERKNHDYSGAVDDDPFANFRVAEACGIASSESGILVRLCDKISRLATFTSRGQLKVKDESVRDTVLDLINYAVLFEGFRLATAGEDPSEPEHPDVGATENFLGLRIAYEEAQQSLDPSTQVGAYLWTGSGEYAAHNRLPIGVRPGEDVDLENRADKLHWMMHAEQGAILQAWRDGADTRGSTMFAPWACCFPCAQLILEAGVRRLVVHDKMMELSKTRSWHAEIVEAHKMLRKRGVVVEEASGDFGLGVLFNGKVVRV